MTKFINFFLFLWVILWVIHSVLLYTVPYLPVVYVNYGDGKVICDAGQKVALSMQTEHGQKVVQH
jgi:hypothetical protein